MYGVVIHDNKSRQKRLTVETWLLLFQLSVRKGGDVVKFLEQQIHRRDTNITAEKNEKYDMYGT